MPRIGGREIRVARSRKAQVLPGPFAVAAIRSLHRHEVQVVRMEGKNAQQSRQARQVAVDDLPSRYGTRPWRQSSRWPEDSSCMATSRSTGVTTFPLARIERQACRSGSHHPSRGRSRWPGWWKFALRVGGHPGGICCAFGELALVRADRLAVDAGDALDLSLAGPGLQQSAQGGLQMRLQDVHSS